MLAKDSPINYWVSKQSIWPQLGQMALNVYLTPPMSDGPERVFVMLVTSCHRTEGA
jgi:hypothetical protein